MAAASFELPNGFVNHGAMSCEALAGHAGLPQRHRLLGAPVRPGGMTVEPVASAVFEWQQALGSYGLLPEWIRYFARAIDDGWAGAIETWVPRLMPTLRTALFPGAIRTAHAAGVEPVDEIHRARPPGIELAEAAVRSLDAYQVKLVEACQRGLAATGDLAFAAAAETVTGLR